MTKEEFIKENAKLKLEKDRLESQDSYLRIEFARAFSWYEQEYVVKNLRKPSWEEIFVKIGKLLAAQNFMDYEGNISEIECKLEDLEKKIKTEIHPNL